MTDQPKQERSGSLRNRIRYRFDNLLTRGTWAVLLWLGAITLLAVLVSSLLLALFGVTFAGSNDTSVLEDFWQSLLRVIDPGTMVADVGWGRRILALLVTVVGILIAGTLIGLIATGIEQRVEEMRRGRSTVVEAGHVVVLGASARLPVVIEQLALANRKSRPIPIVVLAEAEPAELQDEIRPTLPSRHGSRIVFRHGDPTRAADLDIAAIEHARAVIVIADDELGDAGVVKSVLAVGAVLGGFDRIPIIAELGDLETAGTLLRATGGGNVHPVVALQSVARTTAFALREPGLNQVVEELLDFRGSDIHLRPTEALAGQPFGDAVRAFEDLRPIGVMDSDGVVHINPPPDTLLSEADSLVVIADDARSSTRATADPSTRRERPSPPRPPSSAPVRQEHILLLGWNALGARLVAEVDSFAAPGSTVEIVHDPDIIDASKIEVPPTSGLAVSTRAANHFEASLAAARNENLTSVVLLGYQDALSPNEADSRTLLTLMVLREQLTTRNGAVPRVLVELLDSDNVELARLSGADDYVVSESIASRFMAQLALAPERRAVFQALYAGEGPSIRLTPASEVGVAGSRTWGDVVVEVYAMGLIAIGLLEGGPQPDVALNPRASQRFDLTADDQLIVIA